MFGICKLGDEVQEIRIVLDEVHSRVFQRPSPYGCKKECTPELSIQKLDQVLHTVKLVEEDFLRLDKRFETLDKCLNALCKKIYEPKIKEEKKPLKRKKATSLSSKS